MYDEIHDQDRHRYMVDQIAAEFGVTRPTIYPQRAAEADLYRKWFRTNKIVTTTCPMPATR
ncbi:hypothetical protein ABLG96_12870 [Nakamurella sp. A5-74]|uniref:Helix-turn-helix domain-containing protein n=1 Tax=Nakamurella sp. A5-74 TaxID=3158264 RepID=A0AAU8DJ28_9ACTN